MFNKGNQNQYLLFGGLAVVLLLAILFIPNLSTAGLPILLLLACPLMMMFMMMGGSHGGMHGGSQGDHSNHNNDHTDHSQHLLSATPQAPQSQFRSREEEVAWLKLELADLKLRQDRLISELSRIENPAVVEAEAVARAADERLPH
ncbi:MAG: hypothetical protein J0I20_32875 [Chloroflexi bacterium]|nr:hypothetical protein [Chloroflexota bacterium]OJV91783.1 MAG: hypothetical protein BGO39_18000 [Chloroflexi bacterium 54-19]